MATKNVTGTNRAWVLLSSATQGRFEHSSSSTCSYASGTTPPASGFVGHDIRANEPLDFINTTGENLYGYSVENCTWTVSEG